QARKEAEEKARREAEEQARKEAEEKARREAEEQALQERLAAEANANARQEAINKWSDAITAKVQNAWRRPPGAKVGWECLVTVVQDEEGRVQQVSVSRCDGDRLFERSVEQAIRDASPLPKPDMPEIFQKEIQFRFQPE
ncbi:MAG: cell envelope integrity protein TolA, partial [Pseudomonadota bacterium]